MIRAMDTPPRPARRSPRATLEMVATRAGVSRGTASRVLSGASNVSPRAVELVRQAAAELRYRPNLSARSLVTGRTGLVGLVVNESNDRLFSDPYFAQIARGAHAGLAEADVALVLGLAGDALERERIIDLAALRLDGLLVVHGHGDTELVRAILDAGVPAVFAGRTAVADSPALWWVDSDNVAGARTAVTHLVERGRRNIATITGPPDMVATLDREAGWREALQDAGLPVRGELIEEGDFSSDSGYLAMRRLLDRDPGIDAVFAANDLMAFGALHALVDSHLRVPEDIAVVGFDDIPGAATTSPGLTTVAQQIDRMGRRMAALMLEQLSGRDGAHHEILETRLVVRGSS
jgi:DNA-binding LacI/PurR family transcriptional regulator